MAKTIIMVAPVGFTGTVSANRSTPPSSGSSYTPDANGNVLVDPLDVPLLEMSGFLPAVSIVKDAQYTTAALQSAVIPAANLAGAKIVAFENTGTTPANLQFDTAANIVAAIPGARVGFGYLLKIRNSSSGANTATITTNTGITLTGTMTIPQNTTREFLVTLTSLTAVAVNSLGTSAAGL